MFLSRTLLFYFFIFFSKPAICFFPEYEHHSRQDQSEINSPRFFDGEYLSDKTTYELPMQWMLPWLSNDKVFQYGAGSLGPTRFLTRGRLKLNQPLAQGLEFKLAFLDRGDYEAHKNAILLELSWKLFDWLKISAYGEPSTLKKDDDFGLAITLYQGLQHSLRLFNTWVDFSYNKRNEEKGRYSKTPISSGLVWRWIHSDSDEASEFSLRHDQETQLNDTQLGRTYVYGWTSAQWFGRFSLGPNNLDHLQFTVNAEKGFEGDTFNTDNGVQRWETERYSLWLQHQSNEAWIDLYGIRYAYQEWRSQQGNVIHSDIIPHLWIPLFYKQSDGLSQKIHGGYEFTWHKGKGETQLRSQLDTNNKLEHRGNLRYELFFGSATSMNILLTMDLDKFGTGETWEGGSIQFSTVF